MRAYVLIQTATASGTIATMLKKVPGIVTAEDLRGPYDAIALASTDPFERPLERVLTEIRGLPSVTRALVAPLIGSWAQSRDGEAA